VKNVSNCANSCPYGNYNDTNKTLYVCTDDSDGVSEKNIYHLFDRIDMQIEVPRVDYEKLSNDRVGESLASIH